MSGVLHSVRGLAWQIGIPLERLKAFADVDRHYHPFYRKEKGKPPRLIDNPDVPFKHVLRVIRRKVLVPHPLDESARASVKGGSPLKHADAVANQRNVAETDLKNCFPKVTSAMVFRRLMELGYGPLPASLLTRLMTKGGHVPQGAPTSDLVVHHVLTPLDKIVKAIATERGLRYSRCMDCFVVAGARDTREALALIIDAILASGLAVRRKKTRNAGARRPHQAAGYDVTGPYGPKVIKSKIQEIRTEVHEMTLAHKRGEEIDKRVLRVRGLLGYLSPTNRGLVKRLVRQIRSVGIPWGRSESRQTRAG